MRIAMITDTGLVYNVAFWDGVSVWTPHTPAMIAAGYKLIDTTVRPEISIGWAYDGTTFTAPPPAPVDPS